MRRSGHAVKEKETTHPQSLYITPDSTMEYDVLFFEIFFSEHIPAPCNALDPFPADRTAVLFCVPDPLPDLRPCHRLPAFPDPYVSVPEHKALPFCLSFIDQADKQLAFLLGADPQLPQLCKQLISDTLILLCGIHRNAGRRRLSPLDSYRVYLCLDQLDPPEQSLV